MIIGDVRRELFPNDVGGKQTLNIGQASQIAQKEAASPGSAKSLVTSAHALSAKNHAPTAVIILSLKI
jgi:hypothetical protein